MNRMKKTRLIVANWKMNPVTFTEAKKIVEATKRAASRARGVSVVVCPPAIYLAALRKGSRAMAFGVQDIGAHEAGAFTGEISAEMARNSGATVAIVGHSERRRLGESNAVVAKKVAAALAAKLTPILCIGENIRDAGGDYLSVVRAQIMEGLAEVSTPLVPKVIIAYEPVWAIGKKAGDAILPADLHEMSIFIKKVIAERIDRAKALNVTILYGGSVEPENAHALLTSGDVDGFLVGHTSLDTTEFPLVIKAAAS